MTPHPLIVITKYRAWGGSSEVHMNPSSRKGVDRCEWALGALSHLYTAPLPEGWGACAGPVLGLWMLPQEAKGLSKMGLKAGCLGRPWKMV